MTDTAQRSEVTELVAQLVELTDQKKAISDRITEVEDLLTATLRRVNVWKLHVPGLPPIQRHGGKKRTNWQHDELFTELRLLVRDPKWRLTSEDDGVIETPEEAVARHIKHCAHVDYWRAEPLRRRGLSPDEYATVRYGRQTIEIVR